MSDTPSKQDVSISPVTGWFVWPFGTVAQDVMAETIANRLAHVISNSEDAPF